jgi:hypothetical protein
MFCLRAYGLQKKHLQILGRRFINIFGFHSAILLWWFTTMLSGTLRNDSATLLNLILN